VFFVWSKLKLRRLSSGKNILDSGKIHTIHNQKLHWDTLWRWWLILSLSLSLFISIFCVLPVSIPDFWYRGKDVHWAKCTVRVIKLFLPKCTQPHEDGSYILPHINLYLSMGQGPHPHSPGHCGHGERTWILQKTYSIYKLAKMLARTWLKARTAQSKI